MTETSPTNLVEYACSNQVATLTLNRPDRLNAFSDDLVRHLADALRYFDLDPEAQVAIICGRGRAFSSGADGASAPIAQARGIRATWRAAGLGRQFRRSVDPL